MRSAVDSETSMETLMLKFKNEKKRHLNATLDVSPVHANLSEKKIAQNERFRIEQEEAIKLYELKLKEQPNLASPPVKEVKNKKRNYGTYMKKNDTIEQERITDDNGKEIKFKKPNVDKIPNPLFVKMQGYEAADRNKSSLKTKKKKEHVDNLDWEDDIPKLPLQDETFVGRPVLKEYYH